MGRRPYADKLRDPRWQRRRLEILSRDHWRCRACGDGETTLHVHHKAYLADDPWDDPDDVLLTLCESCHEEESRQLREGMKRIATALRRLFDSHDIVELASALHWYADRHGSDPLVASMLLSFIQSDVSFHRAGLRESVLEVRGRHRAILAAIEGRT